ncbi:uncharacterized protein FOMMEDRAFT_141651 [Fomitiporia mediterranea MF3/22]|uniref:uncharacterized protein n=1 Tax=Fomitiporia mediterranea (strain MF3/22) TaxID=694068 RepID=UPI0004409067|nr:uncharacterized protein FOMMEDRAFT_141651 [Fomitiporia mediterranea MF3/22]EJD00877.1 hypothetical protein FOMMEDRAFT_141651 [Fomitiporia mediterranea MF3/22]
MMGSVGTEAINTPVVGTESSDSSGSSVPADTPPDEKPKSSPSASLREITGQEALRAHIEDSTTEAYSTAERYALGRPVILGERTMSSGQASIAALMHDGNDSPQEEHVTGDSSASAPIIDNKEGPHLDQEQPDDP